MKKRALSLLLTLTMLLSLVPAFGIGAAAEDSNLSIEVAGGDELIFAHEVVEGENTYSPYYDGIWASEIISGAMHEVEITLNNPNGQQLKGYRFLVSVSNGTGTSMQIFANDGQYTYDIVKTGWGPADGFTESTEKAMSQKCYIAATAGTYTVTLKLVQVGSEEPPIAQKQIEVKVYDNLQAAVNAASNATATTLKLPARASELEGKANATTIPNDKIITLDLNGSVLKGDGSGSVITNNGTLTIKDSGSTNVHKYVVGSDGLWAWNDSAEGTAANFENLTARPDADAVIIVKGGAITGYGIVNKNTLTIDDGNIVGNSNDWNGGILNDGGTLNVNNGKILGNKSLKTSGGGIINKQGTATIGTDTDTGSVLIEYNTGSNGAGGVLNYANEKEASLTINKNCKISYNFSEINGGGVENYAASADKAATITMNGGEISNNNAKSNGGGICNGKNCTLTLAGGTIKDNKADKCGGGIYNRFGTINMTGAEITNNTAGEKIGGVYNENGTFTMTGGKIEDNTAATNIGGVLNEGDATFTVGGTATISGNKYGSTTVSNLVIPYGKTVSIATGNDVPAAGMSVGVTMLNEGMDATITGKFTSAAAADYSSKFFADDSTKYEVRHYKNGENYLARVASNAPACEITSDGNFRGNEYDTIAEALTDAGTTATTIKLIRNVDENLTIASGTDITLDLNGYVLKAKEEGSVITNNGTLTVKDSNTGNQTHKFTPNTDGLWVLDEQGTKTVAGGVITGGTGTSFGDNNCGGAIYNNGTLTIEKGNIVGNTAKCGGGVALLEGSSFIMNGGAVEGNTSSAGGAGIFIWPGSSFTMNEGAAIKDNTAKDAAGGVYVAGRFTMNNGEISNNNAGSFGGGVYIYKKESNADKDSNTTIGFEMKGGKITNNSAKRRGGGVCVDYYDLGMKMTGGEISGNKVTADSSKDANDAGGGGIWVGKTLTLGGTAVVKNNTLVDKDSKTVTNNVHMPLGKYSGNTKKPLITLETSTEKLSSGAVIGISLDSAPTSGNPVAFTENVNDDSSSYFTSDSPAYSLKYVTDPAPAHLELAVKDPYKWYTEHTSGSYFISNIDELEALAVLVNSGTFNFADCDVKLADDFANVDSNGNPAALITPIGTDETHCFIGKFRGNGKNVALDISGVKYAGLFGYAKESTTILNISTSGCVSADGSGDTFAGGIVGKAESGGFYNSYSSVVISSNGSGTNYAGGLVGYTGSNTGMYNCYFSGSIGENGGTSNAGGITGFFGGEPGGTNFANCFYASPESITYSCSIGTELPTAQMKAAAGATAPSGTTWTELSGKSMVNALNEASLSPNGISLGFLPWGAVIDLPADATDAMKVAFNNGYPVFAAQMVRSSKSLLYLYGGKAYRNSGHNNGDEVALPIGLSYQNGKYVFENYLYAVTDPWNQSDDPLKKAALYFEDPNAIIELKGENQIGVNRVLETIAAGNEVYVGIESNGNLTFTGGGNLTVFDLMQGICANQITFDSNFTGTVTVNDAGDTVSDPPPCCCLNATTVNIQNGNLYLNNSKTDGINASTVNISGGTVTTKGGDSGIDAVNMTISGGTVTATGNNFGICVDGGTPLNITGGTVTASGSYAGLFSQFLTITGGTVYAKGGNTYGAVFGEPSLIVSDTMEVLKASSAYVSGTTTRIFNNGTDEYVVIKAKQVFSGGDSTPTITVPVSGDKDTVKVQATVNGTNATIKNVTSEEITEVGTGDNVVIDLSSLNKSVTGVTIPKTTMENVAASEAKGLEVKLPNGTVAVFDKTTLAAVASQAKGANIQLVVDRDSKAEQSMTKAQKETVSEMNKPVVLDAYFTSNGQRISDFKGGEAELIAEYPTTSPVRVWYVTDVGEKELVPSTYDGKVATFTVTHFSHYVIEMLDGTSYNTCPQDETCVYAKFSDANPKEWYHSGVHFCVENGYMNGVDNGLFAPNSTLSRGMIVTMLWRIEGSPVVNYAMSFKDVADDFWYTEAIRWAQSTGVVLGYDESTFGPEDNVTREQLAAILWRYAKYKGYDVSVGEDTNILSYDDAIGGISEYAISAMQWACGAGIINGIGTRLEARGFATRAQAACMIQRFCVNVAK